MTLLILIDGKKLELMKKVNKHTRASKNGKNIYLKIANKHDELARYSYINHDKVINSWKNELMEKSRDKILEFNNNHNVKTNFFDITDFNRWEKIRTYEKSK